MALCDTTSLLTAPFTIASAHLGRDVMVSPFLPVAVQDPAEMELLLLNDGQLATELGMADLLQELWTSRTLRPFVCLAIHAGPDRIVEYGVAGHPDYKGRGARADAYAAFVLEELLPEAERRFGLAAGCRKSFAGFSLGGLSALDLVWRHPQVFSLAGVFSGALWWRTRDLGNGYSEETDRIIHARIREGVFYPGLRFFFETGTHDETMDRNNNGVIDSIDDTLALIDELTAKGYSRATDIYYLELSGGKHDAATWAMALPHFLEWGLGRED